MWHRPSAFSERKKGGKVSKLFEKRQVKPLTAVGQHEGGQGREGLIRGDVEAAIVQGLNLVVLYVVPAAILPVLDGQRESIGIVLGWSHEERSTGILLGQKELISLLPRDVLKVPTG